MKFSSNIENLGTENALKNNGVAFLTRNHFGSLNERQDENLF